jgi:hypothetical protein
MAEGAGLDEILAREDVAVRVAHEVVALAGGRNAPDRPGRSTTCAHADVGNDR